MLDDIQTARAQFLENGYDPIPLKPNDKKAAAGAWERRSTASQWDYAQKEYKQPNIGLRAGNGKAFIDCDDKAKPGTADNVIRWLDGLGYNPGNYPLVQTASGIGRHVYVNFTGTLFGSGKKLVAAMGAGELKYGPGTQVATFPSTIDAQSYTLLQGDIARLPELDIQDIAALVDINQSPNTTKTEKRMSAYAYALARGAMPEKFAGDRSRAEAALILSLVNSEFNYEDIKQVFENNPCAGHYRDLEKLPTPKARNAYLWRTYQNELIHHQHESHTRRLLRQWIEQAHGAAWSNANRRLVLVAHLETAHKAGKLDYSASFRDIALSAGVQIASSQNQTRKLITDGLIEKTETGEGLKSNRYILNEGNMIHTLTSCALRVCIEFPSHDAFRNGGGKAKDRLGRRAGQIYELIFNNPLPIAEIVRVTGADRKTVKSALAKMNNFVDRKTGEVIEMVTHNGDDTWIANLVDLDRVAASLGTYPATFDQRTNYEEERREYKRERREHARSLELGTLKAGRK